MSCWDHRPRKNEAWTMNMWTQFNQNEVRKGCCLFFRGMHQCCSCLLIKCAPPVPNWNVTCNNWTSDAGWPWFLWISSNQGFSAEFSVSGVKLPRATFSKCPDLRNVFSGWHKVERGHGRSSQCIKGESLKIQQPAFAKYYMCRRDSHLANRNK